MINAANKVLRSTLRPHVPSAAAADQSHGHVAGERGLVTVAVDRVIRARRRVDVHSWIGVGRILAPLLTVTIAVAVILDVDFHDERAAFVAAGDIIARG